jgi:hypothetical protein
VKRYLTEDLWDKGLRFLNNLMVKLQSEYPDLDLKILGDSYPSRRMWDDGITVKLNIDIPESDTLICVFWKSADKPVTVMWFDCHPTHYEPIKPEKQFYSLNPILPFLKQELALLSI